MTALPFCGLCTVMTAAADRDEARRNDVMDRVMRASGLDRLSELRAKQQARIYGDPTRPAGADAVGSVLPAKTGATESALASR